MKDYRGKDKDSAKKLQSNIILPISILIPSNSQTSIVVVSINNIDFLTNEFTVIQQQEFEYTQTRILTVKFRIRILY